MEPQYKQKKIVEGWRLTGTRNLIDFKIDGEIFAMATGMKSEKEGWAKIRSLRSMRGHITRKMKNL